MKRLCSLVMLLSVMFLLGCGSGTPTPTKQPVPLIGEWERFGDDAAGTVVEVRGQETPSDASSPDEPYYEAVLVTVKGNIAGQFQAGEIKWRNLVQVEENRWQGEDKYARSYSSGEILYGWATAYFTLHKDGTLYITHPDGNVNNTAWEKK